MNLLKRKGNYEKVLIGSDLHGIFMDKDAFRLFLGAASVWNPDRIIINGDFCDFPTISEHAQKIETLNPELFHSPELGLEHELNFVKSNIIEPLKKLKKKTLFRVGNHEMRLLRPNKKNAEATSELLSIQGKNGTLKLDKLLDFGHMELGYEAQDVLYGSFTLIHGVKTASGAAKANLQKYGSGSSGHSHRDSSHIAVMHGKTQGWYESGHMRTFKNVEYLPHGDIPDWQQAFLTLYIDRNDGHFFCNTHNIVKKRCMFFDQLLS